jgi:hypothetical protein
MHREDVKNIKTGFWSHNIKKANSFNPEPYYILKISAFFGSNVKSLVEC